MALVEKGFANFQVLDSANKRGSGSFNVSPADARAYLAAADASARLATAVGTLLARAIATTRGSEYAGSVVMPAEVGIRWMEDTPVKPATTTAAYISNKWKVTGRTTNAGFPAVDTVYLPEYLITGVVMESNGISADLADQPVADFVTSFVATALSKFNTPFTAVISIERNDS